ncbi:MAG: MBL fold metallo-hydrolase [Caldilineaceae bacterium]
MSAPTQITENLWSITRGANIFILRAQDGQLAIIDAGIPGALKPLKAALAALDFQPSMVKKILVTHADMDHVGSLHGIAAATGARVYAGSLSKGYIESATSPPHIPALMALIGRPIQLFTQPKVKVDQVVQDGDLIDFDGGIQAVFAPGHTEDNFCYYWLQAGVLFAPDLFTRFRGKIEITSKTMSWDVATARTSAYKVLALKPQIICFGHGLPLRVSNGEAEMADLRQTM